MLVLITYDVNTQTVAGRTRLRKEQKNVPITASESKILSSSARWMRLSADR